MQLIKNRTIDEARKNREPEPLKDDLMGLIDHNG